MIDIYSEELEENYLLANTPEQLYKWFRASRNLFELAKEENKDLLIEEYRRSIEKENRNIHDIVKAYGIIIVFTFFDYLEGRDLLNKINLDSLKWGEQIAGIYKLNSRTTIFKEGHVVIKSDDNMFRKSETSTATYYKMN